MKKITKIIIVSLVVLSFIFVLASCAILDKDPVKLAQALDDESYDTEIMSDADYFEEMAEETGSSDKDVVWMMNIDSEGYYDAYGTLIYVKKTGSAKDLQADLEEYIEEEKKNDTYGEYEDTIVARKGKYVFVGSEEIWNDLLGKD